MPRILGWSQGGGGGFVRAMYPSKPEMAHQVFAVDWSADGSRVASGSKDCSLKLWRY